jgi:hypothetical protein
MWNSMKRKRSVRNRRARRCLFLILLALLALLLIWPRMVHLEGLVSPYAILVDADSGEAVAEKEADVSIYPASMTKVMTALLALEANPDLEQPVTLPEDIFPELRAEGASMAGFQPGETATVRDLLYGALLPSGAECCEALAREVSGSEEAFVELMNQKAAELGMRSTHFCNPTGLHDPEHVSTVRDMAAAGCDAERDLPCHPERRALRRPGDRPASGGLYDDEHVLGRAGRCLPVEGAVPGRQNWLHQRGGALSGQCRTGEGKTIHPRHGGCEGEPRHRALPYRRCCPGLPPADSLRYEQNH